MEITTRQSGAVREVVVAGRLDAYWADHLARALEEAVRDGAHDLRVDLGAVPYISSAGLRVLLASHKQLQRIRGSCLVSNPSAAVRGVLEMAGLGALIAAGEAGAAAPPAAQASAAREHAELMYEVFELEAGACMRARLVGSPEPLDGCRFTAAHCRPLALPPAALAVGLGAFGTGYEDCQGRFGEFVGAAGAVACLPGDGSNVPDYLLAAGALVPEVQVLYAIACEGGYSHLVRFEASRAAGAAGLSALAALALEIGAAPAVALVMVAETAGLIGAALRRSPAGPGEEGAPFRFPEVRRWLSLTPERAFARGVSLVAGVAARESGGALAPLFEAGGLQGVLHLLHDDRPIAGAGGSELVRGALWLAPLREVAAA